MNCVPLSDKISNGTPGLAKNRRRPRIVVVAEQSGTKSNRSARELQHVNKNIQTLCKVLDPCIDFTYGEGEHNPNQCTKKHVRYSNDQQVTVQKLDKRMAFLQIFCKENILGLHY